MYVVTAGKAFNDIDAFGCAIAYAELLRKEGKNAQAVFIGPLNHSVTELVFEQGGEYTTEYTPRDEDRFIYVDLSGPDHFAFADQDESKIFEIYDHHYGYEEYWRERLGERSHIERVGAAGTLIWEEFKKRGLDKEISSTSANVLALAILQNTLNFTSSETNERDLAAFKELGSHVTMTGNWQERYFEECSDGMHTHFDETLRNDTKTIEKFFSSQKLIFSQLEITENPVAFLERYRSAIDTYWSGFENKRSLINIADIVSKFSVLYSDSPEWLHSVCKPLFSNTLESTSSWIRVPIYQRKQILKLLQNTVPG